MRISCLSSDVCSSDLIRGPVGSNRADRGAERLILLWRCCLSQISDANQRIHADLRTNMRFKFHAMVTRFHRSEEHTSELQSLMRISYAVFCLKKKNKQKKLKAIFHTHCK